MAGAAVLEALASALNERQQAYLLAAYDEDQAREGMIRGLTPYEYVLQTWTKEPKRFKLDPS